MRLIQDDFEGVFVWVEDLDENIELSPQFDDEHSAILWKQRMKKILTGHDDSKGER
jgi:hypothetical protein